ncbi:CHC2 zinc finger domain-containing protein [Sulfobacillus thermosulfidooxidans]|uniref:CHC2 zinc finger domain-containing protein n=1 Tax=Sulfobacillus thermosulfidooxidans TaxID=28034 RepID=UPI00031C4DED|nr:CHC2 zinc finger domain-containing protein [Sulfobacillus thermosulfidooxidans]
MVFSLSFQDIKARVDLVALIGSRVALKRQGARWIGRCPFHDDHHPSFDVSPAHHVWRCWSCGVGGDAVDWVRLTENCSTNEALQRLTADFSPKSETVTVPYLTALSRASRATRDAVYTAILRAAGLTPAHQHALESRGLSAAAISAGAYASFSRAVRAPLLGVAHETGLDLRGVPGIGYHPASGRFRLEGPPGLLIPVRDRRGRIQACQIRRDDPGSHARYQWWTSAPRSPAWTGTSPGTPFHVAGHTYGARSPTWWITEGPLKADVAAFFLHAPVLGIPGVGLWERVGRALSWWHPRRVVLAFDQDADPATRDRVRAAQDQLGHLLEQAGIRVFTAQWPEGFKGIDDALAARQSVRVVAWREGTP